jgi:Domain of unknown function (DUF4062)
VRRDGRQPHDPLKGLREEGVGSVPPADAGAINTRIRLTGVASGTVTASASRLRCSYGETSATDKTCVSSMPAGRSPRKNPKNISMRTKSRDEVEPLLIDRAAAAELPTPDAVREWAREKRAFISSVMSELPEERRAAAAGARAAGVRPVMFEEFGGRDADPKEADLAEVVGAAI